MSRKPKPPVSLVIEGLSDGREVRDKSFVDDFTGEIVPIVQDTREARELPNGFELRERIQRERECVARALLERVGILPASEPVLAIPKGKMIAGTITQRDGTVLHVLRDKPPFRRL